MWCRIEESVVVEITDVDPANRFHPDLIWLECNDEVKCGWIFVDGEFLPDSAA